MQFARLFLLAIPLVLLTPVSPAHSDGVKGQAGMLTPTTAKLIVKRYRSIPGDGVKGEAGMLTPTKAKLIVKRYKSIPGDGVKGEAGMLTPTKAKLVVKRYRSIPGDGVKGEAGMLTPTKAKLIVKRYRSIPGDGVKGEGRMITRAEATRIVTCYKSIPGGFLLEEGARGLEWVKTARYDAARNALILDKGVVYALPVSAPSAALLARAIAADDRIGVSLGEEAEIVFGKMPEGSDVALHLKLADNFLGDMILPPQDWTIGYRFADGFTPVYGTRGGTAVFFSFSGYEFARKDKTLVFSGATFDARVVPVLKQPADDGGYLPDFKALESGEGFDDYLAGAKHIAGNINYYLKEKIMARALAYGEMAAFFRTLKAANINLRQLARGMDPTSAKPVATPAKTLEEGWAAYLTEIQAANEYANWTAPPRDLYAERKKASLEAAPAAPAPAAPAVAPKQQRQAAASEPPATDPAVANCLAMWDAKTHMTRQQWALTCQRVQKHIGATR